MKKSKTVKIQIDPKTEKEFTVTELSVANIINLSQKNPLFGATLNDQAETAGKDTGNAPEAEKKKERGMLDDLMDVSASARGVMEISCDFKMEELKPLAPSDIDKIFKAFKEVNATFLTLLEKMGIIQATKDIVEKAMSDFLRTLAI